MCLWQKYIKKCLKFRLLCHFAFFRVLYKPWHAINMLHMNPQSVSFHLRPRSCIYTKGFSWNQSFIVMRFLESPRVLFGVSKGPWAKRMCIPLQKKLWKINTLSYLNQTLHTTPQDLVLEPSCVSEVKKVTQSLKMWSVQRCWYTAVTKNFFPASVALSENLTELSWLFQKILQGLSFPMIPAMCLYTKLCGHGDLSNTCSAFLVKMTDFGRKVSG